MDPEAPHQLSVEQAERAADEIAEQVRQGGLAPAFAALEKALDQFSEAGYPIDAIVPASAEEQLGFALGAGRDGKSFWNVYAKVVRDEVCKHDGALQEYIKSGVSASTGAILNAVMTGLGLPGPALAIAVPIAAILAAKGIDAFCLSTSEECNNDG